MQVDDIDAPFQTPSGSAPAGAAAAGGEWAPPDVLAPRPVVVDAAMVRAVRATDGRGAREVLGPAGE